MSLLLKALQKSESERQQHQLALPSAPTQPYAHSGEGHLPYQPAAQGSQGNTIIHTGGGSSAWLAVVLGCNMMLVIAMAFFWFQSQQREQDGLNATTLIQQALNRPTQPAQQSHPPGLNPAEQSLAESLHSGVKAARKRLADEPKNDHGGKEVMPQPMPALVRLDSVAESAPLPATRRDPKAKKKALTTQKLKPGKLYEMQELDPQLLAGFPELHYNAHLYTPDLPSARMFMANDTRYGEKDTIDNNTRVEAIVPEGVIFNFKGLRVKVNVVDKLQ